MMKKNIVKVMTLVTLIGSLSIPQAFATSNNTTDIQKLNLKISTEYSPKIVYEENDKDLPSKVKFVASPQDGQVSRLNSLQEFADGETTIDKNYQTSLVYTVGKTKGKKLTVVTSATAYLWEEKPFATPVCRAAGEKSTAIGYGEASSSARMMKPVRATYRGTTLHTAAYDGVLYELKSSAQTYWDN